MIYVTRPLFPDREKFKAKIDDIWESQWLSNGGEQHQYLEAKLTEYLKVPYLSLFNNGTIALVVAIQSLRLAGDVITTPFTFPATSHVLTWNGIEPNFCDIDPVTMNLDPAKIESCITPKTTGILATHVFGTPCDMEGIQEIADYYGLKVVYDGAHVFGCEVDGMGIGNFGDITMFSFHPTKLFHTGEGGALSFRDESLKKRVDLLKNFGIKNEFEVVMPGINGKMNELQAAMGLCVLECVEQERMKRMEVKLFYDNFFSDVDGITTISLPVKVKSSLQYYPIRINRDIFGASRDDIFDRLKKNDIHARKYFYPLCSDYICYQQLSSSRRDRLSVAYSVVDEILCLPFYGDLNKDELSRICEIIIKPHN
jgi:dTDP-4-amino-4,6-dideoxygalactose transaminase